MLKKIFRILVYIFAAIGFFLVAGYLAVTFKFTNVKGVIDRQSDYFQNVNTSGTSTTFLPASTDEWRTFSQAIIADRATIQRAARVSGVSERLIISPLVTEQLRLYFTNREVFKSVFAPLKVLGNQSQFSWGIMGFKQETAEQIERNLKNPSSPYYLGKDFEHALDLKTTDPDRERFKRLTNEDDRYYSYLYAGIYLKQLMTQWEKAGHSISDRPEILATLFNIGFDHSKPNPSPKTGGSELEILGKTYSFGSLAHEFYYSDELTDQFPRK